MFNKLTASIIGIILAASLSGCASQTNKDPLEGFNRGVYKFNDTADKAVIFPTINDGVKGMAFIEAVLKSSAKGGKWVKLTA